MIEAEFLRRMDAHIAVAGEHMARSNELHEDQRQFMRDIMRRLEIFGRDLSRELHEIRAETRANTSVLNELSEDIRSQRGALLALVDELRDQGHGGRG